MNTAERNAVVRPPAPATLPSEVSYAPGRNTEIMSKDAHAASKEPRWIRLRGCHCAEDLANMLLMGE